MPHITIPREGFVSNATPTASNVKQNRPSVYLVRESITSLTIHAPLVLSNALAATIPSHARHVTLAATSRMIDVHNA